MNTICYYFRRFLRTRVSAGSGKKDGIEEIYSDKWVVHPKYEKPHFDIALIKLKTPFTKHRTDGKHHYTINAICLPDRNASNDYHGQYATLFGFGQINDRFLPFFHLSNYLQRSEESHITICGQNIFCTNHPIGSSRACSVRTTLYL